MTRYFTAIGKTHTPASFRAVILLEDRILIQRHLELYAPQEFNREEIITTDRYVVDAFLRKREYAGRQWQEIAEDTYWLLEKQWRACSPSLPVVSPGKKAKLPKKAAQ